MKRMFVHEVGRDEHGTIIEYFRNRSGSTESVVPYDGTVYSRMKHGDPIAIETAARELFTRLLSDEEILCSLIRDRFAITNDTRLVPTASFTIMQVLVEKFLKPFLITHGTDVVWVTSCRKGAISEGDYGKLCESERKKRMAKRHPYFPQVSLEKLLGRKVILFDDLRATGSYEENQRALLANIGITDEDILPLFWVQLHEDVVWNPQFEFELNYVAVKGIDDLLKFFFRKNLVVNARTVKYVFSKPEDEALAFFVKLSTGNNDASLAPNGKEILVKLYRAVTSADGYAQMELYRKNAKVLDHHLREIGVHPEQTEPIRIAVYDGVNSRAELPEDFQTLYSLMKHGNPRAVQLSAMMIMNKISDHHLVKSAIRKKETIVITSSAFGEVPTAAFAVARHLAWLLEKRGVSVVLLKIDRDGDFGTTNYGKMTPLEREDRLKRRNISISAENRVCLKDRLVIVVDDLNATGSHERSLHELLNGTEAKAVVFSYLANFSDALAGTKPETEEELNHALIRSLEDLVSAGSYRDVFVNARLLKFLLFTQEDETSTRAEKLTGFSEFLKRVEDGLLVDLYRAAVSSDGYYKKAKFCDAFHLLADEVVARRFIDIREVHTKTMCTVQKYVDFDESGRMRELGTNGDLDELAGAYSLMKFGSRADVSMFADSMAQRFISRLQDESDTMLEFFQCVKEEREHIVFFSPGSRNVVSAQNLVYEQAIRSINGYLAVNNLPTIIFMHLTRLGSNIANYAILTADDRMTKPGNTSTKIPGHEFFKDPIHVIFGDDVRITGTTANRVERICLENGALSFRAMYNLFVDPAIARTNPQIENALNMYRVKGELDHDIAYIMNQQGFVPVQRLIRLVLARQNRKELKRFAFEYVSESSIRTLYEYAMSNDYMQDPQYAESLTMLGSIIEQKGMKNSGRIRRLARETEARLETSRVNV